jgi:PmbA protein
VSGAGFERTPGELLVLGERAIERARRAGAREAEACVERTRSLEARAADRAVESVRQSTSLGLGLRVIVDGRVGFASSTDLGEAGLDALAARAVALARHSSPDEANGLPRPVETGEAGADDLALWDAAIAECPVERALAMAIELECATLDADPRITRTDGAGVATRAGATAIVNSHGVARAWSATAAGLWVVALAGDGPGKQQGGVASFSKRALGELPAPEAVALDAVARAVARLGARRVPSARIPVVMHPDVAGAWLAEMHEAFSAEAVLKQSSWLTGKLGEAVASEHVTLVDDGRRRGGVATEPWDGEGVATRRNVLIEHGRCAMFLYDAYHARRAGTLPTGSAVRGHDALPGVGHQNLSLEPGDRSPEAILASVDRGFFMDDQGSFGFNPVTGDYSFQAQGFWIERGEKAFPVEGVTVASNSLDMLRGVAAVGSDLEFRGTIASPTLLIAEMTIAGS